MGRLEDGGRARWVCGGLRAPKPPSAAQSLGSGGCSLLPTRAPRFLPAASCTSSLWASSRLPGSSVPPTPSLPLCSFPDSSACTLGYPGPAPSHPPNPPAPPPGCRLPALQAQPPSAAPSCGSPGPTHSGQTPAPARWPTWPTRSVPWRWHCQHHQTQLRPFHPLPQGSACLQLRPQFPQFRLRPPPSPSPGSPGDRPGQQAGSQGCLRNLAPTPFTRAWAPEAQEGALPSLPRPSSSAGPEAWPRQTPAEGARAQARTPNAPASWGSLPGAQCSAGPAPTPPGPALRQGWPGATTGSGQPFAQGLS